VGHANPIVALAVVENGGRLLTASSQYRTPDRVLRAWETATGKEVAVGGAENLSPEIRVESVAFAPDGRSAFLSHGAGQLNRIPLSLEPAERKTGSR
jgi:hypothetical protein